MSTTQTAGATTGATTTDTAAAAAAGTTTAQGAPAAAAQGTTAEGTGTPAAAAGAAATSTPPGQAGAGAGTTTGNAGATPAEQPAGPPAEYTLTVPEGGHLDQADVDAFKAIAKSKGLTNEAAQAVLNEQAATYKAQSAAFLQQLNAHPEVGGAHLEGAQLAANKFLDQVLPATTAEGAALRSLFTKTGYGNHPAVVLMLARAGKAMGEDSPISDRAGARGATRIPTADVLFPSAKK